VNKVNSSKRFLIIFISGFIAFIIIYPLFYHSLVKKDNLISHSYKDFLLRHTQGSRLIIDSGSNSLYGINSRILEKELGVLTINIADNGSIPLQEKLYRLDKFSHKGDVVLLPIEWLHYFSSKNSSHFFLENLFDELNFYYNEMSFLVKLQLISETPFSSVLKKSIVILNNKTYKARDEYMRFINYKNEFNNKARGDYQHTGEKPILTHWVKDFTCNEGILGNNLVLSSMFKKNVTLINKLQKKGVHVLFTWPVVVGDNCYQGEDSIKLKKFVVQIKNYLKQNNIIMIGEPEDSLFKKQAMFDSYYHVNSVARDIRTNRLLVKLKNLEIITYKHKNTNLNINEIIIKNYFINSFKPVKLVQTINIHNTNAIFLASGWYLVEPWGIWSQGNESILYVKLATNLLQQNLKLVIENNLYGTQDKTTVLINDKKLGDYLLEGKKSLIIPKKFLENNDGLVKIQFNYFNVKSPLEYGLNRDERKIKFGLKSLQFRRVKSNE